MANEVCFLTLGLDRPWSLETYMSVGGYEGWKRVLAGQLTPEQLIDEVKKSGSARSWRCRVPSGTEMDIHAA
jgi:NADH-quinone oxidoreductase subunit F